MMVTINQHRRLTGTRHAVKSVVGGLFSCWLVTAAGCSGGGMSLLGITPTTTQVLDAGQTLTIEASVVNDTTGQGASFALAGPGSLSSVTRVPVGDSDQNTVTYTAPSSVTGTTTATVTATSLHTPSQTASVTITIHPALVITTASLPNGTVGLAYSATLASTGGTAPTTWAVSSGALPTGLHLNGTTGAITGTPTVFGSYTITVSLTDSATTPNVVTQTYTFTIAAPIPTITTSSLPSSLAGAAYSQQLSFTGGNGSAPTWSVVSGSLPGGLTLNSATGLISGTTSNSAAGATYSFGVSVVVGAQTSATQSLSIVVPALPTVTTTSLPLGNIGVAYSQQLTYSGGAGGAVSWAVASGSLPAGLTLNTATGVISGTPTTQNTYNFSVTVTVGTQTSVAQSLSIAVFSLIVTSSTTAVGEAGLPFVFYLTAQGGTPPYTWSVLNTGNALPAGLTLNATTGVISGTPTTQGTTTNVVLQAHDTLTGSATVAMTFTINAARGASNNAELTGQYAFLLNGFDASGNPLAAVGTFTADGNGNITAGVIDSNGTGLSGASTNVALQAGTFSVGSDNRGKLTMVTAGGTRTYVLSLGSITSNVATAGYLTEFDSSGQSLTGVIALQTTSAFTTASITSGYAFGLGGFAIGSTASSLTHRSMIGELQFNGTGGISSGEMLSSATSTTVGGTTPVVPTSATLAVASNGRGTLSLTRPGGANTLDYVVYVVSTGKLFLLSTDAASGSSAAANDLLSGTMLQQTTANGNFAAASLSGTAVMRATSLETSNSSPVPFADVKVGLYSFNATSGTASLSADENQGGTALHDALSGTYTVAANGRVFMSLTAGLSGCTNCISSGATYAYLVGTNQGFLMDFTSGASAGSFEPQTATGITNASYSGSYAVGTLGPVMQNANYFEGVLTASGAGAITSTVDVDADGDLMPDNAVTATYTIASNGRGTVTPASGDSSVVYVVSATKVVRLDVVTANPVVVEVVHQ